MSLPSFQLLRPKSLDEAVNFLAKYGDEVKVVAGGTDLLPSMKQKLFTPPYVLDLRGARELRGLQAMPDGGLCIGAMTTLAAIEHSTVVRRDYAVLYQATQDGCVACAAEHGNTRRQHLSRYSLPLV